VCRLASTEVGSTTQLCETLSVLCDSGVDLLRYTQQIHTRITMGFEKVDERRCKN